MIKSMVKYGVIPVGGKGVRLRNIIGNMPKVLTKFEDVEILTYPLLSLIKTGTKKVILITTDYTHENINKFVMKFMEKYKIKDVQFKVINAKKSGTAKATYYISNQVKTPFFYTNGDIIFYPEILQRIYQEFISNDKLIAVVTGSKENIAPTHPHFLMNEEGYLTEVQIYPDINPSTLCSMETAIFSHEIFDYLKMLPQKSLTMESLNLALKDGKFVKVLVNEGFWYHLATPQDIAKYNDHINEIKRIQNSLGVKLG